MWGTIGVFSRELLNEGITPLEIAFWRAALAGAMFVAHAAAARKLRVRTADLPALLGFGFVCVTIFYGAYQIAVRDVGIALASVLLYTAPAWVALLSWRLLGETMTRTKVVCVSVTVLGVACISLGSNMGGGGASRLQLPGLLAGLLAGLTYALYYVFGKRLLGRYATPTIFAYALPMGAAMLAPALDFAPRSAHAWTMLAAMAVISSYGAFTAHYAGLRRLEATRVRFNDEQHLMRLLSRMVASHGRHLDEANPSVDARLPDGSRLHAMVPPLSSRGPVFAIRRSRTVPLRLEELAGAGTLTPAMGRFLAACVRGGRSILVSGGAAAGKTTLLNVLSRFIPATERVVTIEETAELSMEHPHVIALEAREPNVEGRGEVTLRTLVRNALRMRADRIIVGEVRGGEVFDMLQAMNVGHNGSMTTVHANSPDDAIRRLETLVLLAGFEVPNTAVRQLLGAAFHLIVQISRMPDGARRITRICEVIPGRDAVETADLFVLDEGSGTGPHHRATGRRPAGLAGLGLDAQEVKSLFNPSATGADAPEGGSG